MLGSHGTAVFSPDAEISPLLWEPCFITAAFGPIKKRSIEPIFMKKDRVSFELHFLCTIIHNEAVKQQPNEPLELSFPLAVALSLSPRRDR